MPSKSSLHTALNSGRPSPMKGSVFSSRYRSTILSRRALRSFAHPPHPRTARRRGYRPVLDGERTSHRIQVATVIEANDLAVEDEAGRKGLKEVLKSPHPVQVLREHPAVHRVDECTEAIVFQFEQERPIIESILAADRDDGHKFHGRVLIEAARRRSSGRERNECGPGSGGQGLGGAGATGTRQAQERIPLIDCLPHTPSFPIAVEFGHGGDHCQCG
jgi:hypothetical protein